MSKEKKKNDLELLKSNWPILEPRPIEILPAILNAVMMSGNELLDFDYSKDESTSVIEMKIRCYNKEL